MKNWLCRPNLIFVYTSIIIGLLVNCTSPSQKSTISKEEWLLIVPGTYWMKIERNWIDTIYIKIYPDTTYSQSFNFTALDTLQERHKIIIDSGLKEIGFQKFYDPLERANLYFGGFIYENGNYRNKSDNSSYHIRRFKY